MHYSLVIFFIGFLQVSLCLIYTLFAELSRAHTFKKIENDVYACVRLDKQKVIYTDEYI